MAILYNVNDDDAETTHREVESRGRRCLVIKADVRERAQCEAAVARTVAELGGLNVLVNNAAFQQAQERFEDITEEQWDRTFKTNIYGYFHMAQAALPRLSSGDAIINTGSIVGMTGLAILIDYTSTKGAIHAFTKSLALYLGRRNIRVNCVVPGRRRPGGGGRRRRPELRHSQPVRLRRIAVSDRARRQPGAHDYGALTPDRRPLSGAPAATGSLTCRPASSTS